MAIVYLPNGAGVRVGAGAYNRLHREPHDVTLSDHSRELSGRTNMNTFHRSTFAWMVLAALPCITHAQTINTLEYFLTDNEV